MTSPTLISPNTGNYRVGKGGCYFDAGSTSVYAHMGNAVSVEFQPNIEKLEHFSSMQGVKEKDASVVVSRSGTLKIVLEEWTPANMALALLGTVDEGASGGPTVQVFDTDAVNGAFKFISNNDVGPRWNMFLHNVSFIPSEAINPLSDEWGQITIEADVLVSQTAPYVGQFGYAQVTNIDS